MINLSSCPRCSRTVTLPEDADVAVLVRCPLCDAEYPLSEALPPALIIVSKTERCMAPAPAPVTGLVTEPFFRQGPTIQPPSQDSVSLADVPAEIPTNGSPGDFELDFAEHLAESESVPAESDESAEISAAALDTSEYSRVADRPLRDNAPIKSAPLARPKEASRARPLLKPLPRRKRKKRGPIRLLIEMILGGGLGLMIAYYGVWWIRGESACWPRYDLPFMPPEEHAVKIPPQPITPASNSKASLSSPTPGMGMPTSIPPVRPVEKRRSPRTTSLKPSKNL